MKRRFVVKATKDVRKRPVSASRAVRSADEVDENDLPQVSQKFSSKKTAVNGKQGKLPAIFKLVSFAKGTINLDYGGGTEDAQAVADAYFADKDVTNLIYDVYNQTQQHNREVVKTIRANGGADTATLSNVLNVIAEPEARLNVLQNIQKLLKSNGTLYITVYEGAKANRGQGKQTGEDQFQTNMMLADYLEEVQQVFPNAKRKGKMIVAPNGGSVAASTSAKRFKVTASDESRKRACRVSNYKEFDNGHVMFDYKQMTVQQAEDQARQASIKDPNNIYYVKFDDVMNPDTDNRWIAGECYHYSEVQLKGDKPVIKSKEAEVESATDPYATLRSKTNNLFNQLKEYGAYRIEADGLNPDVDVILFVDDPDVADFGLINEKLKSLGYTVLMTSRGDPKVVQYIAQDKSTCVNVLWYGDDSIEVEVSLEPTDIEGSENITASASYSDAEQYWLDEFDPLIAEIASKCGLDYDDSQANPSDSEVYHRFLTYISPKQKRAFEKKMKQFETAVKSALASSRWPEYIKVDWDYMSDANPSGSITVEISIKAEAPMNDDIWSSTDIQGAFNDPEPSLDPPEYDEPEEVEGQDTIDLPLDLNLIVIGDGWDYEDESYDWAAGPGTAGDWYSEEHQVFIGDRTTIVEKLDELLEDLLPDTPGVYHISGTAHLVFNITGIDKYSEFQGVDEDGDPIIDETFNTEYADVEFDRQRSSIEGFQCDLIGDSF